MGPPDVDEITAARDAADHLYGLPPEQFVDARNALVKALRAASRRDLAKEVAGFRKPTALAAELNRVLRLDVAAIEELLSAADALRLAQQGVVDGTTTDLSELKAAHHGAVASIVGHAERQPDDVNALISRASLDPGLADALRAASFVHPPEPQLGFDLLTPTPGATVASLAEARARRAAPGAEPPPATTPPVSVAPDPDPEAARAAEIEAADRALEWAHRRLAAAEATFAKASQHADEIERRLADARAHEYDAKVNMAAAQRAVQKADARVEASRSNER
ncbi:MAG: hypothetical protein AAF467_06360 [Actinomycetota bacterium]